MIELSKINGTVFYINPHLIERIDPGLDTVITMNSQTQYIVKDSIDEIKQKIISYRKKLGIVISQE